MIILQYWFNLFINPVAEEFDLQLIQESLEGEFEIQAEPVYLSNGRETVLLSISPSTPEVFIDFPDKKLFSNQIEYETWFADFLEANVETLRKFGFDNLQINMKIYHL